VVANIRYNKPAVGECVDHVSGLFVDLDFVEVSHFPGDLNPVGISRELSHPSEFNLDFMGDWGSVIQLSTRTRQGYLRQAFQPSGGAPASGLPFGEIPYRFEAPWYIEDSFASMNVAHDLDRVDNKRIVLKGNSGIISSRISTGSIESITRNIVEGGRSGGRSVVSVAGDELWSAHDQSVKERHQPRITSSPLSTRLVLNPALLPLPTSRLSKRVQAISHPSTPEPLPNQGPPTPVPMLIVTSRFTVA
jgi:hypothetical protein